MSVPDVTTEPSSKSVNQLDEKIENAAPCKPSPPLSWSSMRYMYSPDAHVTDGSGEGADVGAGIGMAVGAGSGTTVGTGIGTTVGDGTGT